MKRILRPILLGACLLIGLATLNSEFVLPEISDELMLDRDDPQGTKKTLVQSAYDANGVQLEGLWGNRPEKSVEFLFVTLPETSTSRMTHLSAANARYIPKSNEKLSGGWLLTDTTPRELDQANRPEMVEMLDPGRFFVRTKTLEFDTLTRHPRWFQYASTKKINELLNSSDGRRQNGLAVQFHMRLTRPILGMILVVMGLSIILRDQTRNVFISTGICLAMCALFYGVVFASRFLGSADYLPPALAAWLPVMIFGAFAFASYDAIHT
jgi:lipopolysaccharide export system permease protein